MTMPMPAVEAVIEILEIMYYCEPVHREACALPSPVIGARVRFSGGFNGSFRVVVDERTAYRLTSDFLGTAPDEVTGAQAHETVSELVNVACGAAMCTWLPSGVFDFSVPEPLAGEELFRPCAHAFSITGETPELLIDIETGESFDRVV